MASTDVIRCHGRLRLSIKQLCSFRYDGALQLTTRDVDGHHGGLETEMRERSLCDLHHRRMIAEPTQTRVPALTETRTSPVLVMEEDGDGGGQGSSTATMASPEDVPGSLTSSGDYVGGCRSGELTKTSFYSFSELNKVKDECGEDMEVTKCLEKFSTLDISYDNKRQSSWPEIVSKLLDLLMILGVKSLPVQYLDKPFREKSPEIFCKNLFLKDRRNRYYLVICDENEDINLKTLKRKLKAYRNFSFATAEEMSAILQVHPGGVTPFALMHGSARDVRVAMTIDLTIDSEALLNFHPLDHTLTLPVRLDQLKRFLAHFRFELEILDMES